MESLYVNSTRKLRPPEDGIVPSNRPKTWLGLAWNDILSSLSREHNSRLARGRGLARRGRVRALWFSPGLAHAEVHDSDVFQVSLRVGVLEDSKWDKITDLLHKNLDMVAALLEGELSPRLLSLLENQDLHLMPDASEIEGDCNCADYLSLCPHMAAIHLVLSDALEGDPFLLLNLRGRTQLQLIRALCLKWGDKHPFKNREPFSAENPAMLDSWYDSPKPLDLSMRFKIRNEPSRRLTGLMALGPPPGGADLSVALAPLYDAGAEAAAQFALSTTDDNTKLSEELIELITRLQPVPISILSEHLEQPKEHFLQDLHRLEEAGVIQTSLVGHTHRWSIK